MKIYKEHNISGLGYDYDLDEAYETGKAAGRETGAVNGAKDGYDAGYKKGYREAIMDFQG